MNMKRLRCVALMGSTAVLAASMSQGIASAQDDEAIEEEAIEEVVVTGSRIKRANLDTIEPSIVIDSEDFDKRAVSNIADLLNELPAFGAPAASPNGVQNGFSVGQNIVNFLGLGSQRTLTLVNGRRYVSSNPPSLFGEAGGLQVDFNTIPLALVERVETIATGGAPTYGSDAIAGTINVIMKDDFEGLDISARYGVADNGDANTYQIQGVIGGNFADDRGNVAISVEYNRQDGLLRSARPFFTENNPYVVNQADYADVDGDGELDDVRTIFEDQRVQLVTAGGQISPGFYSMPSRGLGTMSDGNFYHFAPGGDLVNYTSGLDVGGSPFFAQGGSGIDLFDETRQIRSPLERIVVSGFGHYDVTDNIRLITEFTFANSEARELVNQTTYQTWAFGGDSNPFLIAADNPFLNAQALGVLADLGLGAGDSFYLHRVNQDITNSGVDKSENFMWRVVTGLEGSLEIGGRDFYWDVSANFGKSDIETQSLDLIDERLLNALDAVRLTDAEMQTLVDGGVGADFEAVEKELISLGGTSSAGLGDIVCRSVMELALGNITGATGSGITDDSVPMVDGCVPINLFGEGSPSDAAKNWVTGNQITTSDLEQRVFTANFGGDIFDLPAGPLAFNIGYETRREKASFVGGGFAKLGLGRSSSLLDTGGEFKTDEFYGELLISAVSEDMDIPLVQSLEFNPKVRSVKHSLAGSDITYTLGGTWGVIDDLKIRGNYTQAIRSPSLVELFAPVSTTFSWANDPCDYRYDGKGNAPDVRRANCAAEGIDSTTFISNVVNATAVGTSGGNPNLTNETAKSWSLGFIAEPRWVPGLTITADYLSIKMTDRIQSLTLTDTMNACYDNVEFPASICSNFTRDGANQVVDFTTGQANAAFSELQAIIVDVNYGFDVAGAFGLISEAAKGKDYGTLDLRLNFIRRIENATAVVGDDLTDVVGQWGNNRKSATLDATYRNGNFQAFWRINYQDSSILNASDVQWYEDDLGNFRLSSGDRFVHNASVAYSLVDGMTARIAVNNVFDRKGSYFQRAVGHVSSGTERLGRNFVFSVRASF